MQEPIPLRFAGKGTFKNWDNRYNKSAVPGTVWNVGVLHVFQGKGGNLD